MTSLTTPAAIVMIADEPHLREHLRQSLEKSGYRVEEAPDNSLTQDVRAAVPPPDTGAGSPPSADYKSFTVTLVSAADDRKTGDNTAGAERKPRKPKQIHWGPLLIDFAERRVVVAGRQVRLTQTEHSLLCILAERAGRLVPNRQIMCRLWGNATSGKLGCLRVHACSLRRKLSNPFISEMIQTDFGLGYRLASLEQFA